MEGQIEKLQNWLNELQTLKSETQIVYNNLEITKKENDNLLSQIFQLKSVINTKDELIEVLQNQKSAVLSDNSDLMANMEVLNLKIQNLEQVDHSQLESTQAMNEELISANSQFSQEIETLQNALEVLKNEQQDWERTKDEWQNTNSENTNLKFSLDQKANQIEENNHLLFEMKAELEEKTNTLCLLEKSIENLGTQLSQHIHKGEIAAALQNQNTLLLSEIEILKSQVESNGEIVAQIDELTQKNIQLVGVTNDLVRDKMEAQWEIAQYKTKELELLNADNKVRETIQDLITQSKAAEEEKNGLITQIELTTQLKAKLEFENNELQETLNILNLNNYQLLEDLKSKENLRSAENEDIERLHTVIKESQSEVLIWENKTYQAIKQKEDLESELNTLKLQFTELEDNMQAFNHTQNKLANHRTNLFSQNEIVEKDYESEMAMQLESEHLMENYDNLNKKMNIQVEKQKHLETMNNSVKLAKNTTSDIEDTNVLKDRINQLVGEIDKCIDLLSNS